MARPKSEVRLTVFQVEKTKWQAEAKKHKLRLSQFVRMIINGKLHIPTEDLQRKVEKRHPDQLNLLSLL